MGHRLLLEQELQRTQIFLEVYRDYELESLSCEDAGRLLGCSERTFRRKRDRYRSGEEDVLSLLDRRIGHTPPNKIAADEVETLLDLYIGGNLQDILGIQASRVVRNDNTISYKSLSLQIPQTKERYHYVKCEVTVHEYPDKSLAIFYGPPRLARYDCHGLSKEC
jgi:hypothetical protein